MKRILVIVLMLTLVMLVGCATTKTVDTTNVQQYTFVVIENKPMAVTLSDGTQKVFNPFELLQKALVVEYEGKASVIEGKSGTPGAIVIEPRKIEVWKRGGLVKEGIFAARVNGEFVEAQFGEVEGKLDADDAQTKVLEAMKIFAKKMRAFAP